MTDRPIIFSGPMVRALLDGRKTQTRRVLKPQPRPDMVFDGVDDGKAFFATAPNRAAKCDLKLPYAIGDRLWVRETWNAFQFSQDGDEAWPAGKIPTLQEQLEAEELGHRYGADQIIYRESQRARKWFTGQPWRSPIHMPRWASRLTLTVTDVRVQRVRDISEADAIAEGIEPTEFPPHPFGRWKDYTGNGDYFVAPENSFRTLWGSIYGPDAWGRNDWVAAVSFDVHRYNIDQMKGPTND